MYSVQTMYIVQQEKGITGYVFFNCGVLQSCKPRGGGTIIKVVKDRRKKIKKSLHHLKGQSSEISGVGYILSINSLDQLIKLPIARKGRKQASLYFFLK